MKTPIRWIFAVLWVLISSDSFALGGGESDLSDYILLDQRSTEQSVCEWVEHGGGGIPIPFSEINRLVELSDGAFYALQGKIVFTGDQPFFEVDLREHPWLGRTKRKENPTYPIIKTKMDWRTYEGRTVRLVVQAKGQLRVDVKTKKLVYQIWLNALRYK